MFDSASKKRLGSHKMSSKLLVLARHKFMIMKSWIWAEMCCRNAIGTLKCLLEVLFRSIAAKFQKNIESASAHKNRFSKDQNSIFGLLKNELAWSYFKYFCTKVLINLIIQLVWIWYIIDLNQKYILHGRKIFFYKILQRAKLSCD